jgi:hypothetical protein
VYAVDTQAHAPGTVPDASKAVDQTGTNMPGEDDQAPLSYLRTFRPSERTAGAQYTGTDAPLPAQLAEHMDHGQPDPRRGRQTTQATDRALEAQPEARANSLLPVAFAAAPAPDRTRGGSTGYDPARPAATRRNIFLRAFDQWAAYGTGVKAAMAAPLADVGLYQPDDVDGALPTANSGRGDRAFAGQAPQPNTFRLIPRPWDENLVVGEDTQGASYAAQQVRSGWRAR